MVNANSIKMLCYYSMISFAIACFIVCVFILTVCSIVCCVCVYNVLCAMCRDLESGDSTALVCESSAQTVTSLSHGKQVSQ